jgi:uncharacterized protein
MSDPYPHSPRSTAPQEPAPPDSAHSNGPLENDRPVNLDGGPAPNQASPEAGDHESGAAASKEQYPFWSWVDVALFLGFGFGAMLVGSLVMAMFLSRTPGGPAQMSTALRLVLGQTALYLAIFGALVGVIKLNHGRPFWRSLAWAPSKITYTTAAAAGILVWLIIVVLGLLMQAPPSDKMPIQELLSDPVSLWFVALFAVTLGPLCEELVFRGFLLPLFARHWGVVAGLLLTSVPFALLHGPQYGWAWQHLVLITVVGISFGIMRLRSGSVAASTVMHASYNGVFTTILLVSRPVIS